MTPPLPLAEAQERLLAAAGPLASERVTAEQAIGRCLAEPSILASLASVLSVARDRSVYAVPPAEGALGARLRENVPTGPFPAPVLVAQGEVDSLVLPHVQRDYVDGLCAARADVRLSRVPDPR